MNPIEGRVADIGVWWGDQLLRVDHAPWGGSYRVRSHDDGSVDVAVPEAPTAGAEARVVVGVLEIVFTSSPAVAKLPRDLGIAPAVVIALCASAALHGAVLAALAREPSRAAILHARTIDGDDLDALAYLLPADYAAAFASREEPVPAWLVDDDGEPLDAVTPASAIVSDIGGFGPWNAPPPQPPLPFDPRLGVTTLADPLAAIAYGVHVPPLPAWGEFGPRAARRLCLSSGAADNGILRFGAVVLPGRVRIGGETAHDALRDPEARRIACAHRWQARACYDAALGRRPGVTGYIVLALLIDENGRVPTAAMQRTDVYDVELERCIIRSAYDWHFEPAAQAGGALVRADLRYTFETDPIAIDERN